jgi:mono/diheme cytochrome c family protein
MDQQERFDPQEPSPFFDDGRSIRMPVAGTVARGAFPGAQAFGSPGIGVDGRASAQLTEHFTEGTVEGEVVNALPSNVALTAELLERGKDRYEIFCTPCHGGAGQGDGIVVRRGLLQPPSYHEERIRSEPLGHLFRVMTYGVSAGTVAVEGGGNMASYASQVPPEDRWAIATYIRSLQVTTLAGTDMGPVDDSMTEEATGE